MIVRIQKTMEKRAKGEKGFTLIELLVVIIIIGILAAIAIPAFLKQREKGWAAQATASLKNASTASESFAVDNNGSYVGLDGPTALADNGYNDTSGVTITVVGPTTTGYVLTALHASLPAGANTYTFTSTTGVITGPA